MYERIIRDRTFPFFSSPLFSQAHLSQYIVFCNIVFEVGRFAFFILGSLYRAPLYESVRNTMGKKGTLEWHPKFVPLKQSFVALLNYLGRYSILAKVASANPSHSICHNPCQLPLTIWSFGNSSKSHKR